MLTYLLDKRGNCTVAVDLVAEVVGAEEILAEVVGSEEIIDVEIGFVSSLTGSLVAVTDDG